MSNALASQTSTLDLTGQRVDLSPWANWADYWEAGLDPGTGITTMYVQGVKVSAQGKQDRTPLYRISFPSVVASGEHLLEAIGNMRNAPKDNPAAKLGLDEYVLQIESEITDDLVGAIAYTEGKIWTDAKGDPDRYWGSHIKRLTLTGLSIIPDRRATVHLNLCMPLSLYDRDNKERVIINLTGVYTYALNGVPHKMDIRVGTVIPEGAAAIVKHGVVSGRNLAVDIGDRTMEIILANGLQVSFRDSAPTEFGVRLLLDDVHQELMVVHGRDVSISDIRTMVKLYCASIAIPQLKVPKGTETGYLTSEQLAGIIRRKQTSMLRDLMGLIRQRVSKDGAVAGASLDSATIYGGGAYLFYIGLQENLLPELYMPNAAEYLNAYYAYETVQQADPAKWTKKR